MTTMVSRWRDRRRDEEEALSLVELMIALMIMGVALLALASVASASLVQVRNSRARQQAVDAASAMIESLRLRDYAAVAMKADDPRVQALGGCAGAFDEPTVETAVGEPVPFETAHSGIVTVRMLVTWFDDGDDQACTDPDHDRTVKRVTALASWTDAGGTRTIEQSTLVSHVSRGLPAPDFRLGTPQVTINWTGPMAVEGREFCVGHVLRNLGAQDGYEWFLERLGGGAPIKVEKGSNTAEFQTAGGSWRIRGFFEYPAQADPINPADYSIPFGTSIANPTGLPSGVELMLDEDGNAEFTPRAQARLDPGEQARVWICYRPSPDKFSSTSSAEVDFRVTVRSRFDPNRFEQVLHGVRVAPSNVRLLYLFDDDESLTGSNNTRLVATPSGGRTLPIYTMGPISPQGLQPEVMSTTASVPNHDTDVDPNNLRGLRLKRLLDRNVSHTWTRPNGQTSTESFDIGYARWHEQFSQATTVGGTATLSLWVSTRDMLANTATRPRRVSLALKVEVLNQSEGTVVTTLFDSGSNYHVYTHATADRERFVRRDINITLPTTTIARDRYLRLEVRCISALSVIDSITNELFDNGDECAVAYDHTTTQSYLAVPILATG